MLLLIDGEPILKKDEDTDLEYVVNTPYFIVKDSKKDDYYITDGTFWYTSTEMLKGWKPTKKIPSKVKNYADDNINENDRDSITQSYDEAPELIIEIKAAEVVVAAGEGKCMKHHASTS